MRILGCLAALVLLAGCVRNNFIVIAPRPALNLAAFNNPACVRPPDLPPIVRTGEQVITRTIEVPMAARPGRVGGCAGVLYRIDAAGRPTDIRVVREYPAGYGYGDAVATALQDFRYGPSPTNAGWHYLEHSRWFPNSQPMRPAPMYLPLPYVPPTGRAPPAPANPFRM